MKKSATKKTKAAPNPPEEPATKAPEPAKAKAPVICLRHFRHGGILYERGTVYTDLPAAVAKRFAHRFGDPRKDS